MLRWVVFGVGLLVGCSTKDKGDTEAEVTYYENVRPMLDTYCTRCHTSNGTAPIDFTESENVLAMAEVMLSQMDEGLMPPPVADPNCRDYVDSERMSLPPEEREMLAKWIELEKPMGDPNDLVQVEPISTQLKDPDLTLKIPAKYVPTFEDNQNPANEYRCFYIEHGRDDDFYITGLAPVVDETSLVHHIVIAKAPKTDIKEKYKTDEGWSCINGEGTNPLDGMVAGWAPGMVPVEFEEGGGMKVGKDDALILQMHYFANGPEVNELGDQSGYEFTTVQSVERELLMFPFGPTYFTIPAGEEAHTEEMSFTLPEGITARAHGTFPHMHVLGSGYRLWLKRKDGVEECGAEADQWDFNNQITYMFKESLPLYGGDSIHFECTWNNSKSNPNRFYEEPQKTTYGERTDEEMCFAFTFLSIGL